MVGKNAHEAFMIRYLFFSARLVYQSMLDYQTSLLRAKG